MFLDDFSTIKNEKLSIIFYFKLTNLKEYGMIDISKRRKVIFMEEKVIMKYENVVNILCSWQLKVLVLFATITNVLFNLYF